MWRFSSGAMRVQLLLSQYHFHGLFKPKAIPSFSTPLYRNLNTMSNLFSDLVPLFAAKSYSSAKRDHHVTILRNELVRESSDSVRVQSILDDKYDRLNRRYPEGYVFFQLMNQLNSNPSLALQVQFLSTLFETGFLIWFIGELDFFFGEVMLDMVNWTVFFFLSFSPCIRILKVLLFWFILLVFYFRSIQFCLVNGGSSNLYYCEI